MSKTKEETVQQWREALKESARTAVEALSAVTPIEENVEAPSTDEASEILGQAILKIRELVRPAPKTVAFLDEEAWYRMKGAGKPSGEYRTPKSALDFVMANPPLNIPPAAEPIAQVKMNLPHRKEKFVVEIGGVEFVREVMGNSTILYHGAHVTPGGHNPKHWTMEVFRSETGKMHAVAYNTQGNTVMNIVGNGNFKVLDRMACNALGWYVRYTLKPSRIHKSARRTAKAAAVAVAAVPKVPNVPTVPAASHPAPLTPEEELADTIKRQKESEAL